MKTFAIYEKNTKCLFIGSPDLDYDGLNNFLRMHSLLELIPNEQGKHMAPHSSIFAVARDSKKNEIIMGVCKVYFPLSFLFQFQSQREKFGQIFDEFRYVDVF